MLRKRRQFPLPRLLCQQPQHRWRGSPYVGLIIIEPIHMSIHRLKQIEILELQPAALNSFIQIAVRSEKKSDFLRFPYRLRQQLSQHYTCPGRLLVFIDQE
ncbi:hypothetical protein D3C80_1807260 [compost metagenome]